MLTIHGSVAIAAEKVKLHSHVVLGRRDGSTIGGHLVRATVRPTFERCKDDETGLSLLKA